MNKKQKNRKLISQNKRNRIINKKYTSTIKTLTKFLLIKLNNFVLLKLPTEILKVKNELMNFRNNLYSIIDKSVKKNVIKKNNAARKKSKIQNLVTKTINKI
jgi:small subunit ribosomal protein S20